MAPVVAASVAVAAAAAAAETAASSAASPRVSLSLDHHGLIARSLRTLAADPFFRRSPTTA